MSDDWTPHLGPRPTSERWKKNPITGLREKRGWDKNGPLPTLNRVLGDGSQSSFDGLGGTGLDGTWFIDHPYQVEGKDGAVTYVAEPYTISGASLQTLLVLENNGWSVQINGVHQRHSRGTVVIEMTRSKAQPVPGR